MKLLKETAITFNDVTLLADKLCRCKIEDIELDMSRLIVGTHPDLNEVNFVKDAIRLGLSVPIQRRHSLEEQQNLLQIAMREKALFNSNSLLWICVGLNDYKQIIKKNLNILHSQKIGVYLDPLPYTGYTEKVSDFFQDIKQYELNNTFSGNIHTLNGWRYLEDLNSDFIRVGVGAQYDNNHISSSGFKRPAFNIINEIKHYFGLNNSNIVCDEYISNSANAIKAFGVGADYLILDTWLLSEKKLDGLIDQTMQDIKRAVALSGFTSLNEFIGQGIFEKINQ